MAEQSFVSVDTALMGDDFDGLVERLKDIGVARMESPISPGLQTRIFGGMQKLTRLPEDEQRPWRLEHLTIPDPARDGVMEPDFGLRPPKQEGPRDDNKYSLMICRRALSHLFRPEFIGALRHEWQRQLLYDVQLAHGAMELWFNALARAVACCEEDPDVAARLFEGRTVLRVLEYTDDSGWGGGQVGEPHFDKSVFTAAIGADKPGLQIRGNSVPPDESRVFIGGRAPHGLLGLDPPRFAGRGHYPPAHHSVVVPEGTDPGRFALVAFQWMADKNGNPCQFLATKVDAYDGAFPDANLPSI